MRYALALILLFIAPEVWGQAIVPCRDVLGNEHRCISGRGPIPDGLGGALNSDGTMRAWMGGSGTLTASPLPSCEPGWELVMRLNSGGTPLCAWVLKEPIYK